MPAASTVGASSPSAPLIIPSPLIVKTAPSFTWKTVPSYLIVLPFKLRTVLPFTCNGSDRPKLLVKVTVPPFAIWFIKEVEGEINSSAASSQVSISMYSSLKLLAIA